MASGLRQRLQSFGRWMASAMVAPRERLLLISRTTDEVILTLRLPLRTRAARGPRTPDRVPSDDVESQPAEVVASAIEQPPQRLVRESVSVRVVGRWLLVRGRRRWRPTLEGRPPQRFSPRAGIGEWLPRPFSASFALPFDVDRARIHSEIRNGTLSIRVGRLHDSTPLA